MEENEVKEQIKKVCFWIIGFFFCFLVVGFFLKSNYPIHQYVFNTTDAYEVITDGLSLSAYFLAPAIAYVLFTDWRYQHRKINNEKISKEIIELLGQILPLLNVPATKLIDESEYFQYQKKYFGYLIDLKKKNELINPNCKESKEFTSKIGKVPDLMHDFWGKLQNQVFNHHEVNYLKDLGSEFEPMLEHHKRSIWESINENSSSLKEIIEINNSIKVLYV